MKPTLRITAPGVNERIGDRHCWRDEALDDLLSDLALPGLPFVRESDRSTRTFDRSTLFSFGRAESL